MGLEQATIREIVEKTVAHKWGIPEFQRAFVWTPQRVRELIDSLWRGYPVGSFLIWYAGNDVVTRGPNDAHLPDAWVVDGQQRTTALCLLLGRKPFWWESDWNQLLNKNDVRFNVLADEEPFFSLKTAAMKGAAGAAWLPVRDVLTADDEQLSTVVQGLLGNLDLPAARFGTIYSKLDRLRKIRDVPIPVVNVSLDLEDVTEIFGRLNSAGTKVKEADIALALAAAHNPGWTRDEFLPFIKMLEEAGFDVDPNLVFRSTVAIGLGRTVLRDVPRDYWKSSGLQDAWKTAKSAWSKTIHYLEQRGILSADILPTKNALIPLALLAARFPEAFGDGRPMAWLIHATRAGRYSGSSGTTLERDAKGIRDAEDHEEAFDNLKAELSTWEPFTADDFLTDYRDRFLRLVLYLVMYQREARDWMTHQRLGFQGAELLERFSPQWHHVFPRAYMKKQGIPEELWNYFANIAVIDPGTNIRFGGKDPITYLERHGIDNQLLEEQLVPADRDLLVAESYQEFLKLRAHRLAEAANSYFNSVAGEEWWADEETTDFHNGDGSIPQDAQALIARYSPSPKATHLYMRLLDEIQGWDDVWIWPGTAARADRRRIHLARRGSRVGAFAFFRPGKGRLIIRLDPDEGELSKAIHAQRRDVQDRDPYKVALDLDSDSAVEEAIELARAAYEQAI